MAKLIILGSAHAVPDLHHENTHMVLIGNERKVLIDCATNPVIRLPMAGVEVNSLTDLILTHFHPDHVSGLPLLLLDSWLLGRKEALNIYGLPYTIDHIEIIMELYGWKYWPNFFPVNFVRLPPQEMTPLLACDEFKIFISPVCHMVPNIGVRIEFSSGQVLAYSSDTSPCDETVKLATGSDVLMHEASGEGNGHTSPTQAGEIATRAGAGKLILIHYDGVKAVPEQMIEESKSTFSGLVVVAQDFMELDFSG